MTLLQYTPLTPAHRNNVFSKMVQHSGLVYLRGGVTQERLNTDTEINFRQESMFFYLTGVQVAGYELILDLSTKKSLLFIPRTDADHEVWCGKSPTLQDCKEKYLVDEVYYVDEIEAFLEKASEIHFSIAITESRVIKSEGEIAILREAARISGEAHIALMKKVKPGLNTERQLHALFEYECFRQGAQYQAYTPIVASGKAGATLHYTKNDANLTPNKDDMLLVDAGCELYCYASDITRTYPVGGKYNGDWKTTYEIVLETQKVVLNALKPGVKWEDMHRLSYRTICIGLQMAGILVGDTEELIENHIPALFYPHGLGHFLGIDVHDCGGYQPGVERIQEPGIRYLRMRRTLEANMVVTVEPGCYFVDALLDPAVKDPNVSKYFNLEVLERFRKNVGGVRIEDDVVITENGIDNLTGWIPKTIEDVEKIMKQD
ncbi:hypothetical protein HK099_003221 [Clydaea vesicula]|uniref:Aminopeptidase P N-terminal domain-containing protein n=1 Tax=Clydaea vesicula TaxID=447962 RepID=A0AAD5XYY6_9FUNG|nr:hypothetical protein HK099_003221 [Clydaea vesicula]